MSLYCKISYTQADCQAKGGKPRVGIPNYVFHKILTNKPISFRSKYLEICLIKDRFIANIKKSNG